LFPLFAKCRTDIRLFDKITLAVATINSSLRYGMHLFVHVKDSRDRKHCVLFDTATNSLQLHSDPFPFLIIRYNILQIMFDAGSKA
jgi:hypothetical protein